MGRLAIVMAGLIVMIGISMGPVETKVIKKIIKIDNVAAKIINMAK